jgi:putative phosphoesterase
MRLAAIYDIHGNLPALEAVLAEIRQAGVDRIVVGGDVLPGPMPRETLASLLDLGLPVQFIQGNGDRAVLEERAGIDSRVPEPFREVVRHSARQLLPEHERQVASWPKTLQVGIPGWGEMLFCHATPRNDTEIFTRRTPEDRLLPVFAGLDVSRVVCGHTHMQFDRMIGKIRVVNAGSVGMPYGEPGAYWLLLGPGSELQLRHTLYDFTQAAARIRDTDYPQAEEFAARNVLQPTPEAEMLERFSTAELGYTPPLCAAPLWTSKRP